MAKYIVKRKDKFWPSKEMKKIAVVNSKIYKEAARNPREFWAKLAREGITWFKDFGEKTYEEKLPYFKWFSDGELNLCSNCIDRHLEKYKDKTALIWIPEPLEEKPVRLTYHELFIKVNKMANVLKKLGVKKGDRVAIYLPMIPEVIISMLACVRIGAIHTVVFSAFSAEALKTRIKDGKARVLITADGYYRRGEEENIKEKADKAVEWTSVKHVLVVKRLKKKIKLKWRDKLLDEELEKVHEYCSAITMNSEDVAFLLYTSGTTGKPKGIIHETGGYAVQAYYTTKWDFNIHDNDIIWCTADVGWITGHTYALYGPLLNGITTLIYEGSIDFPNPGRVWKIIQDNKVSVFYTAPTALRMFQLFGEKWPKKYNLSSLKVLGTVGEPIDNSTWNWYFKNIGKSRLPIIDTWWQTETGGTLINSLPSIGPIIPTFAGKSFPGTKHAVIDESGKFLEAGKKGLLVQLSPFAPGMLRGVWKNRKRYRKTYWPYKKFYLTGDNAFYDKEGNFRILGRSDDVLKVAGHRLSTAELENAIHHHPLVAEVAIVSQPDNIKGEVPIAFVKVKKNYPSLKDEIVKKVNEQIGPIAKPKEVYFVSDLPKTRSGKIMRRVLKALLIGEKLGDLSTLVNPEVVDKIKKMLAGKK